MNNRFLNNHVTSRTKYSGRRIAFPLAIVALFTLATTISLRAQALKQVETETAAAQDTTSSVVVRAFEMIPDRDLDLLTSSMRSEMILYMQATDSAYHVRNIYGGESWIEQLTPDYLRIHLTDVSSIQVKELPYSKKGESLIMTIYTVAGESDTADSTIKFYSVGTNRNDSTVMTELPAKKFFAMPNPKDFYDLKAGDEKSGSRLSMEDIMEEMPFHTVAYTIQPDKEILTGRLTMSNYLTLETRRKLEPYIRQELQWDWDGKKFRRIK